MKLAALTLVAAARLALNAAALNPADVSASAGWIVHHDQESFVGGRLLAELKKSDLVPDQQEKLASMKEHFGFNPETDLTGVTLYGSGEADHGVLILRGKFDVAKLRSAAVLAQDFKSVKQGDREIWSFTADKGKTISAVATPTLLIGSSYPEDLAASLLVLDKKSPSLATPPPSAKQPGLFAWVNFTASGVKRPDFLAFRNARELTVHLREEGDSILVSAQLDTGNAEGAKNMAMFSQGLLGMAASDTGNPLIAEIRKTKIQAVGENITLESAITIEHLKELALQSKKEGKLKVGADVNIEVKSKEEGK